MIDSAQPEPQPTAQAPAEPAKPEPIKVQPPKPEPQQQTAAVTTSPLRLPYVQPGIFGVPQNATRLIKKLKSQGIPAISRSFKSKGKTFARVLAGPFQSTAERNAAQRTIRKMGLKDAVPVRR